jgi:hypothetical protein
MVSIENDSFTDGDRRNDVVRGKRRPLNAAWRWRKPNAKQIVHAIATHVATVMLFDCNAFSLTDAGATGKKA